MLTVDSALGFLLDRELVHARDVVDGDVEIADAARRNRNLRVTRRSHRSYLIKQPDPGEPRTRETLTAEARFYAFCDDPRAAPLLACVPRLLEFHPEPAMLILELVRDAVTLRGYYASLVEEEGP